jgi:homoserine dehydrogenase
MKPIDQRIFLCGLGNVGKAFLQLLLEKREIIREKEGVNLILAGVADTSGSAYNLGGELSPGELLKFLESGGKAGAFESFGKEGMDGVETIRKGDFDVLIECTPTNPKDIGAGFHHMMAAIRRNMNIITANKGPLVLQYGPLHRMAKESGVKIGLSAATAAALPTVDIGSGPLVGTNVESVEGILNGTTNYILTSMTRESCSYEEALESARKQGIAETDPSLDVEGWDTGNKILLIANRLFGMELGPKDISVKGITDLSIADIEQAGRNNKVVKLVGSISSKGEQLNLEVSPRQLEPDHPLARVDYTEKGISFLTDTMGRITVIGGKSSPVGAAAALLKDLILLSR